MHEDLLNAVSNLVHRHVLVTLQAMIGAMLARLDDGSEATAAFCHGDTNAKSVVDQAPATEAAPAARLPPKPETVARRARKRRAQQRLAANGAGAEALADWRTFREAFRAAVAERRMTYRTVAPCLEAKAGTLATWLSRDTPPSTRSLSRMRRWLREAEAPIDDEPSPAFMLSEPEQAALRGHISLGADRDLRHRFGVNQDILGKAAAGEHLAPEVIAKLRGALATDGAAAE